MHGRAVGTVTPNGGGAPVSFENKYVWVLRKGARDRWHILRVMWNSNTPGK
jgi:ketosteroid isomerase-like protein